MKYFELDVEHSYKGKFVGRHRLKPSSRVCVIGSGRNADIRLLGDDVGEIHAYIENQKGEWTVIDASSQQGTWIQKKPITQHHFSEECSVNIGGHVLKLTPKVVERNVFAVESVKKHAASGSQKFHQVIIKKNEQLWLSELIGETESYAFSLTGEEKWLHPPRGGEVIESSLGPYTVIQRIVGSSQVKYGAAELIRGLSHPEMRAPIMAVLILFLVIGALLVAIPQKPNDQLAEVKPDNKYTRMIYDAALVKKKREQAKEMRKTIMASQPKVQQTKNTLTTPVKSKGATPKVVSKLKLDGINAMLGKIAKRANLSGPTIKAFGQSADSKGTSGVTTVAAVGSLQGISTGAAGNGGETYKVGGVGTIGKAGTGRSVAGIGGLAAGGAGSGTVGILDEETEIEGGLDKEVIARVIANYLGEIRYCYERQLSAEPDIYGKVQVKFTIDGNGSVMEHRIGATSLNSAMVEGCILRRLARWKFPKPKGGTHVLVTYPFMFKATN